MRCWGEFFVARYIDSSCTDFETFPLLLASALHEYLYVKRTIENAQKYIEGAFEGII